MWPFYTPRIINIAAHLILQHTRAASSQHLDHCVARGQCEERRFACAENIQYKACHTSNTVGHHSNMCEAGYEPNWRMQSLCTPWTLSVQNTVLGLKLETVQGGARENNKKETDKFVGQRHGRPLYTTNYIHTHQWPTMKGVCMWQTENAWIAWVAAIPKTAQGLIFRELGYVCMVLSRENKCDKRTFNGEKTLLTNSAVSANKLLPWHRSWRAKWAPWFLSGLSQRCHREQNRHCQYILSQCAVVVQCQVCISIARNYNSLQTETCCIRGASKQLHTDNLNCLVASQDEPDLACMLLQSLHPLHTDTAPRMHCCCCHIWCGKFKNTLYLHELDSTAWTTWWISTSVCRAYFEESETRHGNPDHDCVIFQEIIIFCTIYHQYR